ncbi:hypothetical protein QE109_01165 [Fusibacter bizertensis]|uniref:Restriction endonuclease n=1 Tax=Fusibacter bizertensis TaxID=1488331 RepID=A0ABT6N8I3_9FIRM|nr:hypothetical protein [Fusibacter bizertensis]MDH8676732.1 hypothetical protein [Fusibacter bizertensis]
MSRITAEIKGILDTRIKSALELIKRNENREAFSILSKEICNIAYVEHNKSIDCECTSALYNYELIFKLICQNKLWDSIEFFMHFIAVDLYIKSLGHKEIELEFREDISKFNVLLIGLIKLIATSNTAAVKTYKIQGYEFSEQLEIPNVYKILYEFYIVRIGLAEKNINASDELLENIKYILSFRTIDDIEQDCEGLVTEANLYEAIVEFNRLRIIDVFKQYRNQMLGSSKANALKNVNGRVEDFIHNFVYPYFVREFNSSYVFSELAVTNFRYDLFVSNLDEQLSLVIELKAFRDNNASVDEPIDQVLGYIKNGKTEILKMPIGTAVVLVFNASGKELSSSKYSLEQEDDLLFVKEDDRVIICEIKM